MNTPETLIYEGRIYALWNGLLVLDWRDRPVLWHPEGCLLCCPVRVGEPPRHPRPCDNCGPRWERRRPDPCAYCQHTAHFTDQGWHVHKACLETVILAAHRAGQTRKEAA